MQSILTKTIQTTLRRNKNTKRLITFLFILVKLYFTLIVDQIAVFFSKNVLIQF